MAYGLRYTIPFKNRIQKDIWRTEIWQKDYAGSSAELSGSDSPFIAAYEEGEILNPVKSVGFTISFWTNKQGVLYYSGNDDIDFMAAGNTISILHQTTDPGILPGMTLVIEGITYHIVSSFYSDTLDNVTMVVSETVADNFLNDVDFAFYQFLSIETFYSDDDEEFRIDHYFQSLEDGTGTEKLLFSGYLVQDGAGEPVTDRNHILTLKATDNLALLKNVKWNEATNEYYGKYPLGYYIRTCLEQTGLYAAATAIDQNLPLRLYGNLFENTTDDRGDDIEADPYAESIIHSGMFQNTDSTWDDCYTILTKILSGINACLCQADGCWNVYRPGEYNLFTDGEFLGTQYVYNGSGTDVDAITLTPLCPIVRPKGPIVYITGEDQNKSMQRPVKYVLNTFNYNQPLLIQQLDLQIAPGAVPFDTNTIGDLRYDDYDLATYFPGWIQRNGDTSYLEIVTDTTTDTEVERYIHKPSDFNVHSGVQFNAIDVTTDDSFDLSLQFRTHHSDGFFWVRFILILDDHTYYSLEQDTGGDFHIFWDGPFAGTGWFNTSIGVRVTKNGEDESWAPWSLDQYITEPVLIPADGILLVEVDGNSSTFDTGFGTYATDWKDIQFTFNQYINQSTQIDGQTHTDTGTSTVKAIEENEINIDDSPRNTIAGTLFTDAISAFDNTDSDTGEITNIGNVYFTRTRLWHRAAGAEALRLGNIITKERLLFKYTSRLAVEGTFRNLRYDTDKFVSILSLFKIAFYAGKNSAPGSMTIDYMDCSFNSKLVEIFSDIDSLADDYLFNYKYKTD